MEKGLFEKSGLNLKLENNKLVFGENVEKVEADIRTKERMMAVLKNPEMDCPEDFYYMYRNVHMKGDESWIQENKLRYDITILPAFKAGDEYNKTFGHYHPKVPNTETWYPEIYEVLHGEADYLQQNGEEFLHCKVKAGEKCVMLPGFGHITVNAGSEALVMSNWVYPGFSSDYGPIEEKKGAEWFMTENGFVKNENYENSSEITEIKAVKSFSEFGVEEGPMYLSAKKEPGKFKWLSEPENFKELFKKYRELTK